ncbi:helix-turn-helix transcriptional regulator [Thermus caliditerrae]|uniref:helix-turn-helix transcriptional regulator n=1 Tax=Thermus caliditerrae TaxID=1330700 RepID=UPI001F28598C|nr:helix-turn-helix transcriptional regulator [Thermus caliditerrae]
MVAPRLRWRLREVLAGENLTVYRLAQVLSGKVSRNTLYAWASGSINRPDLEALAWVLWALRKLTGKPYGVQDLLEYEEP